MLDLNTLTHANTHRQITSLLDSLHKQHTPKYYSWKIQSKRCNEPHTHFCTKSTVHDNRHHSSPPQSPSKCHLWAYPFSVPSPTATTSVYGAWRMLVDFGRLNFREHAQTSRGENWELECVCSCSDLISPLDGSASPKNSNKQIQLNERLD